MLLATPTTTTNNWIGPINLMENNRTVVKKYVTPDQINYAQQIPNSFSYDRAFIWILNSGQISEKKLQISLTVG